MKIIKTKKMIFAVVTALVLLSTLPFLQSCSSNEPNLQESKQLEYLDVDVSNLQNATDGQKLILKKAKDRIDPYVVLIGKEYSLTVTNASEVQMSERLFYLVKNTIANTNLLLKDLNVVPDIKNPRILHLIKQSNLGKNQRFKILGYEATPIDGQNSWNADWDGFHLSLNDETTDKLERALIAGASVATIAGILGIGSVAGAPAGAASAIVGVIMGAGAAILDTYNDGNGVTINYGLTGSFTSR